MGPGRCISNKYPHDIDAAGLGANSENLWTLGSKYSIKKALKLLFPCNSHIILKKTNPPQKVAFFLIVAIPFFSQNEKKNQRVC